MKRLCLILFVLLLAAPAMAEEPLQLARMNPAMLGSGGGATQKPYCLSSTTCTTGTPGNCDLICEDFEGSTECKSGYDSACRLAWDVSAGSGQSIDFTTVHNGSFACTDKGTNAGMLTATSSGASCAIWKDLNDQNIMYGEFYFNINSITLASGSSQDIFTIATGAVSDDTATIQVYNKSGTLRLYLLCDACAHGAFGSTALSTGTWYRVQWEADTTNDHFTVYLNGSKEAEITDYTSTKLPSGFYVGWTSYGTRQATAAVIQYDNISVSSVGLPGGCN